MLLAILPQIAASLPLPLYADIKLAESSQWCKTFCDNLCKSAYSDLILISFYYVLNPAEFFAAVDQLNS